MKKTLSVVKYNNPISIIYLLPSFILRFTVLKIKPIHMCNLADENSYFAWSKHKISFMNVNMRYQTGIKVSRESSHKFVGYENTDIEKVDPTNSTFKGNPARNWIEKAKNN